MPASKTRTSIWSGQTLTAGAGNTTVSFNSGMQTNDWGALTIRLTNGSSGPGVAAQVQVQFGNDSVGTIPGNLFSGPLVGLTTNNGVQSWYIEFGAGPQSIVLTAGSNTTNNVTVDADVDIGTY